SYPPLFPYTTLFRSLRLRQRSKSSKTTPRHCGAGVDQSMSARMDTLAAKKSLLIARSRLQRMELALHAGAARESLRPASLVASRSEEHTSELQSLAY